MHQILEILEEATDSAGPDLISLDDLKFALGITGISEDAQLQAAITFQSRIIAEYCDRRFGRAEALETFSFYRGELVPMDRGVTLSLYPVTQIHEVSTAGATAADYEFDPPSGRLWLPSNYLYGSMYLTYDRYYWTVPYKVQVVYSGGYDLPEEAPARLQRAVIESVNGVRTLSAYGVRDPSIREVQHGDTRISYVSQSFAAGTTGQHLTPSVTDLIQAYRRISIA